MRFIIIRKADQSTEKGCMPSDALLASMGEYNQALVNAGIMRGGDGLRPSKDGLRIRFSNGAPSVTDGPFAETRELIAGYTIIEVDSKEEAIEWAKKWPPLDGDGEVELELRQYFEMEDFEQGEGLQIHRDLSEQMAKQPSNIGPYLFFDGNCRQAFELYEACLGGRMELMTYADAPEEERGPSEQDDKVMHACLRMSKWFLMGSDAPEGRYEKPQGFCVQVAIDDPERAEQAFTRLAEGGSVRMPFEQTFWAYRFGMLVDRFGIPWMINCDKAPEA